jgi:hypothetical protein
VGRPAKDLTGRTFGRWTVLRRGGLKNKHAHWWCQCSCEKQTVREVSGTHLRRGHATSCGCYIAEVTSTRLKSKPLRLRHGGCLGGDGPTYRTWLGMKNRCSKPGSPTYERYGARGISVCPRWIESFDNFLADMGIRPTGTSIERIDNDGNYEPSNCKWATRTEQSRNRRNNIKVVYRGVQLTLSEACERSGARYERIRRHMLRGETFEAATVACGGTL